MNKARISNVTQISEVRLEGAEIRAAPKRSEQLLSTKSFK